jgi:hypothetical protein
LCSNNVNGISWNGKIWVAVGNQSGTGTSSSISYSWDSSTWINATNVFNVGRGVAWNGSMWVAVGEPDTNTVNIFNTPIAYSYDGICWKKSVKTTVENGYCIDWNGTMWVAGGSSVGPNTSLSYSYDGDFWYILTSTQFTTGRTCYTVVWNGTMWVAGGDNGILEYSYDGLVWIQTIGGGFSTYLSLAWNGSMWLVGGDTGPYYIAYSYDGVVWDTANVSVPPLNTVAGITWDGNKWIATLLGAGAGNGIQYSYDGFVWYSASFITTSPSDNVNAVAWNKNLGYTYIQQPVISLGSSNDHDTIAYSLDGIKYTGLSKEVFDKEGRSVAWNGTMWVGVGDRNNTIAYSYDGIKWTPVLNSTLFLLFGFAVVWSGINWIAGGVDPAGSGPYLLIYSPDGINWFPPLFNPNAYLASCYGLATDVKTLTNSTSTTVAVGSDSGSGFGSIIYSQDDGMSWNSITVGTVPISTMNCVAWNGTTWLAGDAFGYLWYSFNGTSNWTQSGSPIGSLVDIKSIAWNGVTWVIVGRGSNPYEIYYSTDLNGSTWTLANVLFGLSNPPIVLNTVIWNGKRWITGGSGTGTSIILTSHDGINWYENPPVTTPANPYTNQIDAIVWGLGSNSTIGGVIVDSQIALNNNNSVTLTKKLDVFSDKYYNNGYNNMVVSVKSTDLLS